MPLFLSYTPTDYGAAYLLSNTTPREVTAMVAQLFQQWGYRLEEGVPHDGVYGTGNAVARALLGGLVKRNKFRVSVADDPNGVTFTFSKAMTGWAGGALGASALRKETLALIQAFHQYFTSSHGLSAPGPKS